ncbi:hypothetical protein FSW04_18570 [Baekduia soli]|uniref:Uncharacterized protein n=1 Tax=Baekduia soli TaxID=496014 RepID=A0A5B8U8D9_9ACTN|nr:type II secretion system protein M [Baekduia soli]QEC49376.1 hypothetical protein FSW04_18570 [Baekduia soli]
MTARDRTVLIVVGLLALTAAFWMLILSPRRKEASDVTVQVTSAQQRLDTARASLASGQAAKRHYAADYTTVVRLGKSVPVDADVPSLVYQLEHTAHDHHVDFRTIKLNSGAVAAAPAASTAGLTSTTSPSVLPPGATVGAAGFPTMPFSFDFNGSFFNMQRFLKSLDDLTSVDGKSIAVKGRLLTVDGVSLTAGPKGFPQIDANVAVTAYLLPTDEGLTAGATIPASGTSSTATTPVTASLIGNK